MQLGSATTEEDHTVDNRQFKIEFKADYDAYSKRVQIYKNRHMHCSGKDATKP